MSILFVMLFQLLNEVIYENRFSLLDCVYQLPDLFRELRIVGERKAATDRLRAADLLNPAPRLVFVAPVDRALLPGEAAVAVQADRRIAAERRVET